MSPRIPTLSGPARATAILVSSLWLAGCPYLGEEGYTEKVRDVDGDGLIAERFGGRDCDDDDPDVGDCDEDGDGVRSIAGGGEDCDDTDALVNPGAPEVCDGVDNDCDGLVDNSDDLAQGPMVWRDFDGDGWGADEGILWCGPPPAGYAPSTRSGDCDDADGATFPGAPEDCDAVDRNCDGDPTLGAADGRDWYADLDGDGHGAGPVLAVACEAPEPGLVDAGDDCAPSDPSAHPSADEVPYNGIDDDCVGGDLTDVDGDGDDALQAGGGDCNDNDIAVSSFQPEDCNGIDDDCDGAIDEGLLITTWPDGDGDQFGDPAGIGAQQCGDVAVPAGRAANDDDCNDAVAAINPSALELCDDVDNDCDGTVDGATATDAVTRWADADGDLFGNPQRQLVACLDDLPAGVAWIDNDLDCDDAHATANPAGTEVCDGLDNDCNGGIDDGDDRRIYYADADADGYGDPAQPVLACVGGEGLSALASDCDDLDPSAYPGAPEICGDLVRQDCSDADPADCDGDGEVAGPDCDDTDPDIGPFAAEICDGIDNDCDGDVDDADADVVLATRADWYQDVDGDGVGSNVVLAANQCTPPPGSVRISGDCDDLDPARTPGAPETCDEVDNDCDGVVDEDVSQGTRWYADLDGDGFGEQGTAPIATQCDPPAEPAAANDLDCNDAVALVFPGAEEACDGIDNDCDGLTDDADSDVVFTVWYLDDDGDGYGDDNVTLEACEAPASYVVDGGDCDDTRADRAPGADEQCDGLDNDCDGLVDGDDPDETEPSRWYADLDGDGFGDPNDVIEDCNRPNGYVENADDCDDTDERRRPGALELCDGVDNDCDGIEDEAAVDATVWFFDGDADGWGAIAQSVLACTQPPDHVALSGDCNDADPAVRPGATEVCGDGIDNDCNSLTDGDDPGAELISWYPDLDEDGSGDAAATGVDSCEAPSAGPTAMSIPWASNNADCDDADAAIGPHALEVCDGVDNDCDALTDSEDGSVDAPRRYVDADGDGFGVGNGAPRCEVGGGWADVRGDCDDSEPQVSPSAPESCNGRDDDCDGQIDDGAADGATWVVDADGDGFFDLDAVAIACSPPGPDWAIATGTERDDCDDGDAAVNDDAPEVCDGVDNDCNTLVDETGGLLWSPDADGDGYGDRDALGVTSCAPPAGYVSNALDCLDDVALAPPGVDPADVHPARVELCNGIDDDCDDTVDDDAADALVFYPDGDGDGVAPLDAPPVFACGAGPGLTQILGDCDDAAASVSPDATEQCGNGIDDDCNGLVDGDDVYALGGQTWYADFDGDGYGRTTVSRTVCDQPTGFVADSTDCNDAAAWVNPGEAEVCDGVDNDCDGALPADEDDIDGDGYVVCAPFVDHGVPLLSGDCDEGNGDAFPGAPEQCNGVDDDCNDVVDDLVGNQDYWPDADGDGFGDAGAVPVSDCLRPEGFRANNADCDDTDAAIRPLATELTGDNVDQNCDGVENCFADADDDGFRSAFPVGGGANGDADCDDAFEGLVSDPVDCDDNDGGLTIEALWYADCDADAEPRSAGIFACGAAEATATYGGCADGLPPDGGSYATAGTDCNDDDPLAQSTSNFYPDCDGDGEASSSPAARVTACGEAGADVLSTCSDGQPPDGGWYGAAGLDCDDEDAAIAPGAPEVLGDGIDQDCDGLEECFADADVDGARGTGPAASPSADRSCSAAGQALAAAPLDCNDLDPTGQVTEPWYADCDADGVADANSLFACGVDGADAAFACASPSATYTTTAPVPADCNDTDPLVYPGVSEIPGDNLDQDCDNRELCFDDADNDGARASTTFLTNFGDISCNEPFEGMGLDPLDCDDTDPAIRPFAVEIPGDEVDQNCDTVESCWVDGDLDGYRDPALTVDTAPGDLTCDEAGTAPSTAPVDCSDVDGTGQIVEDWFADCDGDGVEAATALNVCGAVQATNGHRFATCGGLGDPASVTTTAPALGDCNELDPSVYPGAIEGVGDSIDQDCSNTELCYVDADDDGFRLATTFETLPGDTDCFGPAEGQPSDPLDCDDTDPFAFVVDDHWVDCDTDGSFEATTLSACGVPAPADFGCGNPGAIVVTGTAPTPYDCDDTDPSVYPFAFETPADGIDQDCDGVDDCWTDNDNDGVAVGVARNDGTDLDCDDPGEGTQAELDAGPDCNDTDPLAQMFDFYAPDCDGDGIAGVFTAYACGEADANAQNPCPDSQPPDGGYYLGEPGTDCNDDDPTAVAIENWWVDCDVDGVEGGFTTGACGQSQAEASLGCLNPAATYTTIAPGTPDCDDSDPAWQVLQDWYPDCDGDGAFEGLSVGTACTLDEANGLLTACVNAPLDASAFTHAAPTNPDCNDTLAAVYPGAPEVCDGWANDCAFPTLPANEEDDDLDGFIECKPYVENGRFLAGGGDCLDDSVDPLSPFVYPGHTLDLDAEGAGLTLQQAIDVSCDNAVIFPASYATYGTIDLPSDRVLILDGFGRNASVDTFTATPAVKAGATPLGTEVRFMDLYAQNAYAVEATGGAHLVLRSVQVYGSGATADAGVLVDGSVVEIHDSYFSDNAAPQGSVLHAVNGADVRVERTYVWYPRVDTDGSIRAVNSTLTLQDVRIEYADVLNPGQTSNAVTGIDSTLLLTRVDIGYGYSSDRQPSLYVFNGSADLEDVVLYENPGGLWVDGSAIVTAKRLRLERSGGNPVADNYEGAVELRGAADFTASSMVAHSNAGPGLHLRDSTTAAVSYGTFVANAVAGIALDPGNENLDLDHSVFWDQAADVLVDASYVSTTNGVVRFQYAATAPQLCDDPVAQDCTQTADPAFITWFPSLNSEQWLLAPYVDGPLWNGALDPSDASFDPTPIIGHTGGPDGGVFYDDFDGDGLYDGWERHWFRFFGGFALTDLDTGNDFDLDGSSDDVEYTLGTNPNNYDTDLDSYDDLSDPAPLDCSIPYSYACGGQ